jgi:hypothetical protein
MRLKSRFENFIAHNRDNREYDCILCLSGGKDSIYLLYLLKEKYKLKVLAYTCDTGFLSAVAKRNIQKTIERLDVEHMWQGPSTDFYKKLYSFWLQRRPSRRSLVRTLCPKCIIVTFYTAAKIAVEKKIPFIVLGLSPYQTGFLKYKNFNLLFFPPRGLFFLLMLTLKWFPEKYFKIPLEKSEREFFNFSWNQAKNLPRFVRPFSALEYNIKKHNEILIREGLISPGDEHPLRTNCLMNILMLHCDFKRFKYSPYAWEFSRLYREGQLDIKEWSALERRLEKEIDTGIFEKSTIDSVLRKLGLTRFF